MLPSTPSGLIHVTPSYVSALSDYFPPSPTSASTSPSICRSPSPPISAENHEWIFCSIRAYTIGSFEAGTWFSVDDDKFCHSSKAPGDDSKPLDKLHDDLKAACDALDGGDSYLGGIYMRSACENDKDIVIAEDPETLAYLLDAALITFARKHVKLAQIVLRQLSEMAAVELDRTHPLHVILGHFIRLNHKDFREVAFRPWRALTDCFQHIRGEYHMSTLSCKLDRLTASANFPSSFQELDSIESNIQALWRTSEARYGPSCERSRRLLMGWGNILNIRGKFGEAEKVGHIVARRGSEYEMPCVSYEGVELVALSQFHQRKFDEAEKSYERSVHKASSRLGWQHPNTLKSLLGLEDCLNEMGKHEKAAEVRRQRLEILREKKVAKIAECYAGLEEIRREVYAEEAAFLAVNGHSYVDMDLTVSQTFNDVAW